METSLGSGKQFSTQLQTRSGEAPPTLYCTKDLKAKTNFSRARYSGYVETSLGSKILKIGPCVPIGCPLTSYY